MTNVHALSPAPTSSSIAETNVTRNALASILNSAVIENEADCDGDIYASDGLDYPSWVSVDSERKLLCLCAIYAPDDPPECSLEVVNRINQELVLIQFHWSGSELVGSFWMTFDTRIDPRHFVKMLRRFASVFIVGVEMFVSGCHPHAGDAA